MKEKYLKAIKELEDQGVTEFKSYGNSMTPRVTSGTLCEYKKQVSYKKMI